MFGRSKSIRSREIKLLKSGIHAKLVCLSYRTYSLYKMLINIYFLQIRLFYKKFPQILFALIVYIVVMCVLRNEETELVYGIDVIIMRKRFQKMKSSEKKGDTVNGRLSCEYAC